MRTMQIFGFSLLGILIAAVVVYLGVSVYFSWRTTRRPEFRHFAESSAPAALPDGSYIGHANAQGSWLGKSFDAKNATGINRFKSGDRYRFHMYFGRSLTGQQSVLKIDYNQPGNPWWLRFIVDEVVETGPNQLLGKIQVNLAPRLAFTIGYFTLQQN